MSDKFPDGNDRTPNDPCLLLSSASVRKLFEEQHGSEKDGFPPYTDADLLKFVQDKAEEKNWDVVMAMSRQVLLKKDIASVRSSDMTREEILAPIMSSPTYSEEMFRQSGRTSRMIAAAVKTAKTGKLVVIVMKDVRMEEWARAKVGNAEGVIDVIHYNPLKKEMIDWDKLQVTGDYARHATFIDHDVVYFNNRKLFRAFSQYDPEFVVKGNNITFVDDRV